MGPMPPDDPVVHQDADRGASQAQIPSTPPVEPVLGGQNQGLTLNSNSQGGETLSVNALF